MYKSDCNYYKILKTNESGHDLTDDKHFFSYYNPRPINVFVIFRLSNA